MGVAKAGDSIGFTVSCTIPAIPGVNAPPFEDKATLSDATVAITEQVKASEEKKEQIPASLQEEEILLAEEKSPSGTVQSIYSR